MSCARVDFVHEEDSSQPTRRFRATRSAAPTPPESPASFFPSLRLCLRNLVSKHTQLPLVEHGRIHHANQDLFDRTVAEPIDDAPDRWPKPVALPLVRGHPVRAGYRPLSATL